MTGDLVWGRHPVMEAVRSGSAGALLVRRGRIGSPEVVEVCREAAKRGIAVREVDPSEFERMVPSARREYVAASIRRPPRLELEDLLPSKGSPPAFLLALDQVQDPQNLGALLRTADATGVDGVILPDRHSAPLSGAVAAASAGAANHVRVARITNLVRSLDVVRQHGIWTVGLNATADQTLFEIDLSMPLCLVLGSEGSGLRRLTLEHCDFLARLPMRGHVASLNVSATGAVAMYEVLRQRAKMRTQ